MFRSTSITRFLRLNLMLLDSDNHHEILYELTWILVNSSYLSLPSIHAELFASKIYQKLASVVCKKEVSTKHQ